MVETLGSITPNATAAYGYFISLRSASNPKHITMETLECMKACLGRAKELLEKACQSIDVVDQTTDKILDGLYRTSGDITKYSSDQYTDYNASFYLTKAIGFLKEKGDEPSFEDLESLVKTDFDAASKLITSVRQAGFKDIEECSVHINNLNADPDKRAETMQSDAMKSVVVPDDVSLVLPKFAYAKLFVVATEAVANRIQGNRSGLTVFIRDPLVSSRKAVLG